MRLNRQVRLLSLLVKHPLVPLPVKIIGCCAIGYLFSPVQLIPSFIPIIGQMDDLFVLYVGTRIVRKFAPPVVVNQCETLAETASLAQIERWERRLRDFLIVGHWRQWQHSLRLKFLLPARPERG